MAWARVQSKSNFGTAATTLPITLTGTPVTGNKIAVFVSCVNGTTISSVKDSNLVTLTQGAAAINATNVASYLFFYDVPATPSATFTVTASGSSNLAGDVLEVSGLLAGNTTACLDGSCGTANGTTSPANSTYSSTLASEFLFTYFGDWGNGSTCTVPSGLTLDANSINASTNANACVGYGNTSGGTASLSRVNSATITASSTAASAYSTTLGVAVAAGDVIVVACEGNGTHVTNGMSVQDSVNTTNFTTILETQGGSASSRWLQTFVYRTPQALASGTNITFTPYAASTANSFVVDVFRGATSTIAQAAVGSSNALGTTSAAPALAAAPAAGSLVLTFCQAGSGTLTPGSPFTVGSATTSNNSGAVGYLLGADGTSTYGSTWTLGTSNTSSAQTVALAASDNTSWSFTAAPSQWAVFTGAFKLAPAAGGAAPTARPGRTWRRRFKHRRTAAAAATALVTDATVTPATVAATASITAPSISTGAGAAPATVAAVATIGAPTIQLSVAISPTTVAGVAAIATPAVSVGGSTTVSPSTVAATATIGAPTVQAGSVVAASTVAATATVPAPTIQAGAKPVPATVAAVAAVAAPSISTGSTVVASTVAAIATVGVATVQAGAVAAPATVAAVAAAGTVTVKAGSVVTPATVAAVAAIPTPSLGGSVVANPSTVAAVATVPAPTVKAGSAPTPATVAAVATIGVSLVKVGATVTAATVTAAATIPTPVFFSPPSVTVRPFTGTTSRPSSGTTTRPSTGTTARPSSGTTARPFTGTTVRP